MIAKLLEMIYAKAAASPTNLMTKFYEATVPTASLLVNKTNSQQYYKNV